MNRTELAQWVLDLDDEVLAIDTKRFNAETLAVAAFLWPILRTHAHGSENAMTYDEIMLMLSTPNKYAFPNGNKRPTRRQVRRACKAMLRVMDKPVLSSNLGAFVACREKERGAFIKVETSRLAEISRNISAAKNAEIEPKTVDDGFFPFPE